PGPRGAAPAAAGAAASVAGRPGMSRVLCAAEQPNAEDAKLAQKAQKNPMNFFFAFSASSAFGCLIEFPLQRRFELRAEP
ncbi:MAG TPA: hypothetical protein PKM77_12485, partial [Ottowia sp.]|nr:hypothetical protein [Ottowia sp.]